MLAKAQRDTAERRLKEEPVVESVSNGKYTWRIRGYTFTAKRYNDEDCLKITAEFPHLNGGRYDQGFELNVNYLEPSQYQRIPHGTFKWSTTRMLDEPDMLRGDKINSEFIEFTPPYSEEFASPDMKTVFLSSLFVLQRVLEDKEEKEMLETIRTVLVILDEHMTFKTVPEGTLALGR